MKGIILPKIVIYRGHMACTYTKDKSKNSLCYASRSNGDLVLQGQSFINEAGWMGGLLGKKKAVPRGPELPADDTKEGLPLCGVPVLP